MLKSKFYANSGKGDYFNIGTQRLPLEDFLQHYLKPEGWLLSLAFEHAVIPSSPKMFDAGAKNYMLRDVPSIGKKGKTLVTPQWAIEKIKSIVNDKDVAIAPDHIIHPSLSKSFCMESRRKFNAESAEEFLELSASYDFTPMAVSHGLDLWERVATAQRLYRMGYRYIGVGGLVPDACNFAYCCTTVRTIKRALPADAKIHVFGLNSPKYGFIWSDLDIESYDGSSYQCAAIRRQHWLQAQGYKLIAHDTVDPGVEPVAPVCECPVCERLLQEGFDTRVRGSRQSTLGRIAHNLGQQIAATRNLVSRKQLALISCVGPKLDKPAPARELYNSQWWRAARNFVEANNYNWFALSARHGLVECDRILDPYDETLRGKPILQRRQWAEKVCEQIDSTAAPGAELIFYTGKLYREFVVPDLLAKSERLWTARTPLAGLNGIGYQLQFFKRFTPLAGFKRVSLLP